jgi:hypothetical protein
MNTSRKLRIRAEGMVQVIEYLPNKQLKALGSILGTTKKKKNTKI